MKIVRLISLLAISTGLLACGLANASDHKINGSAGSVLTAKTITTFDQPWAMSFLPDGSLLVTEKAGTLQLVDIANGSKRNVKGVPKVAYGGQGGLGDVVPHPDFANNQIIYLSYAEQDATGNRGAVLISAKLSLNSGTAALENIRTVWQQIPKVSGRGHYSYRIAFSPDGYLFITSGDRQKKAPAQSWSQNLGKVIRLHPDGSVPTDNPFQNKGELAKTFWSLGHRNMLGIAFDSQARLWTHEMGPQHGDEFNLTVAGDNYGWPLVSWGNKYSGLPIADHDTRPEFNAPEAYWVPSIAPSGLVIYNGEAFSGWQGNALIGGLRSQALIRLRINGNQAKEIERFDMGERIREVEQGPDGKLWVLEDRTGGRLMQLSKSK